jgi:ubiquinone/menaquinone biosynthesis C-methylase UbiE
MRNQSNAFLNGEGDNWYERNKHAKFNAAVIDPILALPLRPTRMLEVGCGAGRYIGELHRRLGGEAFGIDTSIKALEAARQNYPEVTFSWGTMQHCVEWPADLVMFGFCLYIMDRADIHWCIARADRMLMNGGYIAIHDFLPDRPTKGPYKHQDGLFTYKMDYAALWLADPAYSRVSCTPTAEGEAMTIIQKTGWTS